MKVIYYNKIYTWQVDGRFEPLKLMIIGSPGSGKSTFARRLAEQLDYPIFYLDRYWHQTDYSEAAKQRFIHEQQTFLQSHLDCIIDGNYVGSMAIRMQGSDVILWLQVSRWSAVWRVIKRSIATRCFHETRPDMAPSFREHFDWEYLKFLKFVWDYPRANRQEIPRIHQQVASGKPLLIIRNDTEKEAFLTKLVNQTKKPDKENR